MSFQIVVVTPEQQVLEETISQAILPAHDGQIGILTGRAPLLIKLGQGPLKLDFTGGRSRRLYVEGGIAQMKENKLTVLTQMAVPAEQINVESARAELAEATAQNPTDARTDEDRARRLTRARTMLAMTEPAAKS
jgi:F-type H+-transporting ATPase subunit epsilon